MKCIKPLHLIPFIILLNGCSFSISPFVRNHTNHSIQMIVKTDTYTPIDIEYLNAFYHPEILDMNAKTTYDFKDSLKYELIDSTSFKLVIPKKSTALISLPYGWRNRDFIFSLNNKMEKSTH